MRRWGGICFKVSSLQTGVFILTRYDHRSPDIPVCQICNQTFQSCPCSPMLSWNPTSECFERLYFTMLCLFYANQDNSKSQTLIPSPSDLQKHEDGNADGSSQSAARPKSLPAHLRPGGAGNEISGPALEKESVHRPRSRQELHRSSRGWVPCSGRKG